MQQFGRDRVESGHCADIVDRSKMTQKRSFGGYLTNRVYARLGIVVI
jgi:hypothetical protein